MSEKTVHLHWLWRQGPKAHAGVVLGGGLCGARNLRPGQFTAHRDDATCARCLELASAEECDINVIPPADPQKKKK